MYEGNLFIQMDYKSVRCFSIQFKRKLLYEEEMLQSFPDFENPT